MRRPLMVVLCCVVAGLMIMAPMLSGQSPGDTSTANVAKAGMDAERLARIPARMQEFVDKGTIAGAVMLVARHGVVASLEAVGYQDLDSKKPMRTDTIFAIASMTKSLTATGVMVLLENGRLLLSDPVEKHLPEFRGQMLVDRRDGDKVLAVKKPSRPITIWDLLTHTSGVRGVWDSRRDKTLADTARDFAREPLDFEPGTKFSYSNAGYGTLGRIIEVVSGQSYEVFMEERVFRPLGMKDTFHFLPPEKYNRIATVYSLEAGKLQKTPAPETTTPQKYVSPSGGCYSTAYDLFAFYQMVLNGGTYKGVRILSRAAVEVMTTDHTGDLPVVGTPLSRDYGFGWNVVRQPLARTPFLSIGSYFHGGETGTFDWIDPKKDSVTLFLIQRYPSIMEEAPLFLTLAAAAIVD